MILLLADFCLIPQESPEQASVMPERSLWPPDAEHAEKPKNVTAYDTSNLACTRQVRVHKNYFAARKQYFLIAHHYPSF